MKIIHITQRHKIPSSFGKPTPELLDETVQAQFRVVQEIRKYPGYPILLEGLYDNFMDRSTLLMTQIANEIFPAGFPKNLDDITSIQKEFIYEQGGVLTLFYLDEITAVYKSIHEEESNKIDKKLREGALLEIQMPRELEAIECAKEAAIQKFQRLDDAVVILVFGTGHNFKSHCEKEGFEYELININPIPQNFLKTVSLSDPAHIIKEHDFIDDYLSTKFNSKRSGLRSYSFKPSSMRTSLFKEDFTSNNAIPEKLKDALNKSGMLKNCVIKGFVTIEKLIAVHQNTPWVIGALRCSNINEGICSHKITVDQLNRLSEEQISSLEHNFRGEELQAKVEEYTNQNQYKI